MLKKYWRLVLRIEIKKLGMHVHLASYYKTNSHNLSFIMVNYSLMITNADLLILLTVSIYYWEMGSHTHTHTHTIWCPLQNSLRHVGIIMRSYWNSVSLNRKVVRIFLLVITWHHGKSCSITWRLRTWIHTFWWVSGRNSLHRWWLDQRLHMQWITL